MKWNFVKVWRLKFNVWSFVAISSRSDNTTQAHRSCQGLLGLFIFIFVLDASKLSQTSPVQFRLWFDLVALEKSSWKGYQYEQFSDPTPTSIWPNTAQKDTKWPWIRSALKCEIGKCLEDERFQSEYWDPKTLFWPEPHPLDSLIQLKRPKRTLNLVDIKNAS